LFLAGSERPVSAKERKSCKTECPPTLKNEVFLQVIFETL
jgi:hypothetical protein